MSLRDFVDAYIECALWSSTDNADDSGGAPLDDNYGAEDIAPETLAEMRRECEEFRTANIEDLDEVSDTYHVDDSQHGHDFWLTRSGHGAGFWDRGYGELGERLSKAARVYGSYDLYIDDAGRVCGQ